MLQRVLDVVSNILEKRKIARYKLCDDPAELLRLAQSAHHLIGPGRAIEIAERAFAHRLATPEMRFRSAYFLMMWHNDIAQEIVLDNEKKAKRMRLAGRYFLEAYTVTIDPRLGKRERSYFSQLLAKYAEKQGAVDVFKYFRSQVSP